MELEDTGNSMTKPYKETDLGSHRFLREFSSDISSNELEWHLDQHDRLVKVIKNDGEWQFQMDNCLPALLEKNIFIPKETYHRVIKGKGTLILEIQNLYGPENQNYVRKNQES